MTTYLITGARSPVVLDLARNLGRDGHIVHVADSWRMPISKYSNYVAQYHQLPPVKQAFTSYQQALLNLVQQHNIDIIIPCCEEAFYISAMKPLLEPICQVFVPDFEFMQAAHSKYQIMDLAQDCGILLPKTQKLVDEDTLDHFNQERVIFKKEYARFGHHVLNAKQGYHQLDRLIERGDYLVQDLVCGQEYCTFAIAVAGKVTMQVVYQPTFRIKNSASMYFVPLRQHKIEQFVSRFVEKHQLTGMVSFDIIDDGHAIYLIECNPRCSSGLHCVSENPLHQAIQGQVCEVVRTKNSMLAYAMWFSALPQAFMQFSYKKWRAALTQATDVLADKRDKHLLIPKCLAIFELLTKMLRHLKPFRVISTYDIEFNKEDIQVTKQCIVNSCCTEIDKNLS